MRAEFFKQTPILRSMTVECTVNSAVEGFLARIGSRFGVDSLAKHRALC